MNRPNFPPQLPKEYVVSLRAQASLQIINIFLSITALPRKKIVKPDFEKMTNQLEKQLLEFEAHAPKNNTQNEGGNPSLGPEATSRILKAKVDVLEEELKALIKERQEKETNLAVAFEKIKSLDDQKTKDQRQIATLTVSVGKRKRSSTA